MRLYVRPGTVWILLRKKGWSQGMLAEHMGMTQAWISWAVRGKKPVSSETGRRLWDAFRGVSHKPGGRLVFEDLFEMRFAESEGAIAP